MHQKLRKTRFAGSALTSILLGIGFLALTLRVSAIAPISDDSELFITGVATVSSNSNLFLSHTDVTSATIYDLVPGLSYEFGKTNSDTTGQLAYDEDFQMIRKTGANLNKQLANAVFWTKYDDTKNKLNLDASFHQADQPEVGIQNLPFLVDRDLYEADALGEVAVTEKTSFGAGAAYDDTEYHTPGYVNYSYFEVPVNYYFQVEPKLDLSAGFRYRDNTLGTGGIDSKDYFYNVGARGEFTPLLTGEFNIGYQEEKPVRGPTLDSLGLNSKFTLAVDPKTSLFLTGTEDYSYAPIGSPIRATGGTGGLKSQLTDQWSINGQVGYTRNTYLTTTQRDDFYTAQLGISFQINVHMSVTAAYTYSEDQSNIALDSFNDNIFSVSGSLHF